jgi:hypothetical protein
MRWEEVAAPWGLIGRMRMMEEGWRGREVERLDGRESTCFVGTWLLVVVDVAVERSVGSMGSLGSCACSAASRRLVPWQLVVPERLVLVELAVWKELRLAVAAELQEQGNDWSI